MAASHRRVSSALPFQLGDASKRKERESNPQGRGPPVFETGYRARWQSFRKVTPAGVEPACGRLRVGCSAVWATEPRCGRQDSNLQRPAFQAGALRNWSYDHADGRGWNRIRLRPELRVRQALGLSELLARALMGGAGIESRYAQSYDQRGARPTELAAHVKLRDKDSNLDLHVQSVTSSH